VSARQGKDGERCDAIVTALRVYAPRHREAAADQEDPESGGPRRKLEPVRPKRQYPFEALVFDTETLVEPAQRLLFGTWRVYRDPYFGEPGATCVEEGLFHPDDLPETDPDGYARLVEHAEDQPARTATGHPRRLEVWPVSEWLQKRLWLHGWERRHNNHVVGFNLPFDLGRLASYWSTARGYHRGGWSLGLWGRFDSTGRWRDLKYHRRLLMRAIDPRRTLFGWGSLKEGEEDTSAWKPFEAPFVDLRTLVFALTDESYDLERACRAFGDHFEKAKVDYGTITPKLIAYARDDVERTGTLYRNCMAELRRHTGIDLKPHRLYSPATVGTRYLEAVGLAKPKDRFGIDPRIFGWAMSAFYGGRAEARIVRTPVPVVVADAASMYPTVQALLGTWSIVAADRVVTEDATETVRELLARADLFQRCFERPFWSESVGVTLVEFEDPDGSVLPVRGYYDADSPDPGIGVNPLIYRGRLWYMLPDLIASVLLTPGGKAPTVRRAIRLRGEGLQDLRDVKLRGGQGIEAGADPFVAMVEERRRIEADPDLTTEERERLDTFLKITANATAYGVFARFDRKELSIRQSVDVYGPDEEPSPGKTRYLEDPGPYCFPPVAASLTAGARLVLAMLERLVTDAGGSYAFCDTDSMAIVARKRGRTVSCRTAEGETIKALLHDEVKDILGRFDPLIPYDPNLVRSFWKVEHGSMDRALLCYAISAKRYALYREREAGRELVRVNDRPEQSSFDEISWDSGDDGLADWSEHGLGMYLDPTDPDDPKRDADGRRLWIREAWEWVLAGDPHALLPEQSDRYALTRFTVASPKIAVWFRGYDAVMPLEERMRPGCFGLIAHPVGFTSALSEGALPTGPYHSNPEVWPILPWYDRSTGEPIALTIADPMEDPDRFSTEVEGGAVRILTLGDVVSRYGRKIEHKSRAPGGGDVDGETVGLLERRPVESAPVLTDLTGKEGNKLIERLTGEVTRPEEYRTDYGERADRWSLLLVPVLREMGAAKVAELTGFSRRAIERALRTGNPSRPHPPAQARFRRCAGAAATPRLQTLSSSAQDWPAIYCSLRIEEELVHPST